MQGFSNTALVIPKILSRDMRQNSPIVEQKNALWNKRDMRCRETGKLRLRVVMNADFINQPHEVSSGLCSLEIKMIVQKTEMEVTKV